MRENNHMGNKDTGIVATLARIEANQQERAVAQARMETKLDAALEAQKDHEARLRSTERWKWGHMGASLPGIGHLVAHLFGWK
jgi:hypothetical protein